MTRHVEKHRLPEVVQGWLGLSAESHLFFTLLLEIVVVEEKDRGYWNDIEEELRRGDIERKAVRLTNVVISFSSLAQLGVLIDYV